MPRLGLTVFESMSQGLGIVLLGFAMAPLLLLGHPYSEEAKGFGHVRWTFAESPDGDRTRVAGRGVRRQHGADLTFKRV
eukprot:5837111-Amphidinium_carterae.1